MHIDPMNPLSWYQNQQEQRENNRKSFQKQIFQKAALDGSIVIDGNKIIVVDLGEALEHFRHRPDLFLHVPFNYDRFSEDREAFENALEQVWFSLNR